MNGYPVRFSVDYPDRDLNRLTTAFRIFTVIPIAILLGTLGGYYSGQGWWEGASWDGGGAAPLVIGGTTGLLFLPPLLMLLFRRKYPAGGSTGIWSSCASPTGSPSTSR